MARFVLVLADPTGSMQLVWFGGVQYWRNAFSVGERLAASGQPAAYGSVLQFVPPDLDRFGREAVEESAGADRGWDSLLHTGRLVPLYPSSQELARVGLDSAGFRRLVGAGLRGHLGEVAETLPRPVLEKRGLVGLAESIRTAHFPDSREALAGAMERLYYEELFIFQVRLALQRRWTRRGRPVTADR